ncbi:MAG: hypothetical protein KKE50_06300 [Nanoarchaeota archaeon]|nr:hypothetical protein [Nanoarchaeota archaeon]
MRNMKEYSSGWDYWHKTGIQRIIAGHSDSGVVGELKGIIGSRGYSHIRKIEKIREIIGDNTLEGDTRGEVTLLLREYSSYLVETKVKKDGHVTSARRIRDLTSVFGQLKKVQRDVEGRAPSFGKHVSDYEQSSLNTARRNKVARTVRENVEADKLARESSGIVSLFNAEAGYEMNRELENAPETIADDAEDGNYAEPRIVTKQPGFWQRAKKAAAVAACVIGGIVTLGMRGNDYHTATAAQAAIMESPSRPVIVESQPSPRVTSGPAGRGIIEDVNLKEDLAAARQEISGLEKQNEGLRTVYEAKLSVAETERKFNEDRLKEVYELKVKGLEERAKLAGEKDDVVVKRTETRLKAGYEAILKQERAARLAAGKPDSEVVRYTTEAINKVSVPRDVHTRLETRLRQAEESRERTEKELVKTHGERDTLDKRLDTMARQYTILALKVGEYKDKEDAADRQEKYNAFVEKRKREEAENVHAIVSGSNFNLPKSPVVYAKIRRVVETKKTFFGSKTEERFEIASPQILDLKSSGDFRLIDTGKELREIADAFAGVYDPNAVDKNKFEELVSSQGASLSFARRLEQGTDSFDKLAMFIAEYAASKAESMPGVVFVRDKNGEITAIGNYDDVVKLKAERAGK